MPIQFIGSASGTTTATMPPHQAGDLIIVYAVKNWGNSYGIAPSAPSEYTKITLGETHWWYASIAVFKFASGSSETVGSFSGSDALLVCVYRGVKTINNARTGKSAPTASTSISSPFVNFDFIGRKAWRVAVTLVRSSSGTPSAPSEFSSSLRRQIDAATMKIALRDTGGYVSGHLQATSVSMGTSTYGEINIFELVEDSPDSAFGGLFYDANGRVIYSSESVSLRLHGVVTSTLPANILSPTTLSVNYTPLQNDGSWIVTYREMSPAYYSFTSFFLIEAYNFVIGSGSFTYTARNFSGTARTVTFEIWKVR